MNTLRILIVDDEALARQRLRTLLQDCKALMPQCSLQIAAEAANATEALEQLRRTPADLALLDIHMPGADGLKLAQVLRGMAQPPVIVFVTAHATHALQAFDLEAVDYLTKPVRVERLHAALQKVERIVGSNRASAAPEDPNASADLLIQERGRLLRVPVADVLYFKAELKYVTVRTAAASYLLDGSLGELEEKYATQFLRVHRNALVAKRAVRELTKQATAADADAESWSLRLDGVDELLLVSRRQVPAVRELIAT